MHQSVSLRFYERRCQKQSNFKTQQFLIAYKGKNLSILL